MAQGEFTKKEASITIEAVQEVLNALPNKMKHNLLGCFNDIFLFLEAAKKAAPEEP